MSEDEKKAAVKDFALTKGLLVALLAGVMSACFNLGLESGTPILEAAKAGGANELFALNPVILLVTMGGFVTNAAYCIFQNIKNKTGGDYLRTDVLANNVIFCALAGCCGILSSSGWAWARVTSRILRLCSLSRGAY